MTPDLRAVPIAVACCGLLAACHGPSTSAGAISGGPPGVLHTVSGIYPDTPCCWLGPDAEFQTLVPADADRLLVTVYTPPDIPKLRKSEQQISVTVSGRSTTFSHVPIGSMVLEVPLAPTKSDRTLNVQMHMSATFVPQRELKNGDTRTLSVYLKAVRTLSAAAGQTVP